MFLLMLFICIHCARPNEILSIIQDAVLGHMYIYDVDDMCTIVLRRISYNGIFVANHSICPEAPIHSDYAATLRELYEYYPLMSNGYVQVPMKSFADAQYQVHARCSHEWNFAQYVDELFPMFEFEECFTHPGSVDAGTYYDSPLSLIHI